MSSRAKRLTTEVGFPISCIGVTVNNEVVLGGGGGPGRSGVKNKLAVYSIDGAELRLNRTSEAILSSSEDAPTCLAIHPKERALVCSINASKEDIQKGGNSNCRVFELAKKSIKAGSKATKTICSTSDFDYQKCIAIDPPGKLVAGGSTDGTLAVVQYPSLRQAFPFVEAAGEVNDVDFNSSGKWLAVATDKELKVISTKDGSLVQNIDEPHTASGQPAVFRFAKFGTSSKSKLKSGVELKNVLYTVLNTKSRKQAYIAMWDAKQWTRLATRPVCQSAITTFALSPSGNLLAVATASLQIAICDAHTLKVLLRIPAAHSFAITALAFDRHDEYLISGSADETCQVIKLPRIWPTTLDGVADLVMTNIQAVAVLMVLLLAILAALVMRR
ncbi:hypothetical protein GGI04_003749 [Coemansia thaxteri]|uniref:Prolactin regulatory element-binding protein n=1 Tax=Coemansia thaxteri TaxID=2663907 RepID=A0A9W8EHW3_9FUNG|nr:hypothetical protein GGI04_003749 [Coemansia thaxteri]KAJ2001503.1 hypothetical protein H4R26_004101 [Coemansia thaxteri]KAJ2470312.1 hypothetical protein GGI02_003007 [Coemansia sp. RSA 2322]KAJ2480453.1 hypothetical protein EV174_003725 [Coemansia sp. RSA 2320]